MIFLSVLTIKLKKGNHWSSWDLCLTLVEKQLSQFVFRPNETRADPHKILNIHVPLAWFYGEEKCHVEPPIQILFQYWFLCYSFIYFSTCTLSDPWKMKKNEIHCHKLFLKKYHFLLLTAAAALIPQHTYYTYKTIACMYWIIILNTFLALSFTCVHYTVTFHSWIHLSMYRDPHDIRSQCRNYTGNFIVTRHPLEMF